MIPKFSVKQPFTVLVGVILVIVLGIVSLTRLSTDLLPDMNLPYAVIMTTYVGASPDAVEATVTIPVEESMATVNGIDTMMSYSSENYSLVILAFDDETDMNSITVDMREKLDQLESRWDDSVGNPLILKINPDMAAVVVAAVDKDGLDQRQLTDYVEDNLIAQLEGMNGVASVSVAGEIEAEIQVIVRQEKIDALNAEITRLLDEKFADAQAELDDGKAELEDGQDELEDKSDEVSKQLAENSTKIIDGKILTATTRVELEAQLAQLKTQLAEVEASLVQIEQAEASLEQLKSSITTLEGLLEQVNQLEAQKAELQANLEQIQSQIDLLETAMMILDGVTGGMEELTEEQQEILMQFFGTLEIDLDSARSQLQDMLDQINEAAALVQAGIDACTEGESQIVQAMASYGLELDTSNGIAAGIQSKITELNATLAQVEMAIANKPAAEMGRDQLKAGIEQIESALAQIDAGTTSLSDALTLINQSSIIASIQMGSASAQLAAAEAALEGAQTQLDNAKETAYDSLDADAILTVSTVTGLLTAQNFAMPAGYIVEGDDSLLVRVGDKITTLEELENLPLMNLSLEGLETVTLADVADIVITDNSEAVYAKVNGNGALILSLVKQDGYSTGDVSSRILQRFERMEQDIEGLHFTVLSDQGVYIDMVIHSVLTSMIYGAILAVIVLFLFLLDLRPTLIIGCSIPVSVVLALVFMYMSNVSINMMSLGGLSLGIGMLVDNSVVVLENIYRYRTLGYDIRSAAVAGTKEVSGAIIASTLTTICVFTGLFFTSGMVIDLLIALALSFTFALLGSLIIALTFVPMMSSVLMRKSSKSKHVIFSFFANIYSKILWLCLKIKPIVIILAVALLVVTARNVLDRGFSFMPDMESTQASVSMTTPVELSFSETMEIADEVAVRLATIQDVETVGVQSGSSGMMSMMASSLLGGSGGSSDPNAASFYIVFSEERTLTNEEFEEQALALTEDLNCEVTVNSASMDMTALMGSGVTIQLYGKDVDKLQEVAADLGNYLEIVEGVASVNNGLTRAEEQLKITVDKEKAADYNMTVAQIFQMVYTKIATPTSIATLELEEGRFDLYVKKDTDEETTRTDLQQITFPYTNADGDKEDIPLSEVAALETTTGLHTINRYNQQRYLSLTAYTQEGYNVTKMSNNIVSALNRYDFPDGYYVDYSGESETIMDAMVQLVEMLLLAVVCIYLIMVAQFQSLLYPFIIMFTIPLAFTGGFIALILADSEISVISMIGFILLAGVIVNNGIVLIDYINQLRRKGMAKRDAIVEAGRTRLRPVLMTTLTTVFAQFFMAMGSSMDAAMLRPMALVTIGGLLYGTLMTLIFVPCVYDLFTRNRSLVEAEINDTIIAE